jgi:uncharacterized repeat protein (TIGR01451 family)
MKKLIILIVSVCLGFHLSSQTYCASVGDTFNANQNINIIRVTLSGGTGANINNTTPCSSHVGSQGTGTGIISRYSDFTNSNVPKNIVTKGSTIYLEVETVKCNTMNFQYQTKVAFFDWNDDGVFQSNEKYPLSISPFTAAATANPIVVPTFAVSGNIRMRIVARQDTPTTNISACGQGVVNTSMGQGETEDYEISIVGCSNPFNARINAVKNGTSLILSGFPSKTDSAVIYTYFWTKNGNQFSGSGNSTLTLTPSDTGFYCVTITASNGCTADTCYNFNGCTQVVTTTPTGNVFPTIGSAFCINGTTPNSGYSMIWYKNGSPVATSGLSFCKTPLQLSDTGCYQLKLLFPNGCVAESQTTCIKANTSPTPNCANFKNFNYTNPSAGTWIFNPTASVTSPYNATYAWTFSNGMTSGSKNPTISSTALTWARLNICIIDSLQRVVCCDSSYKAITNCQIYCAITKSGDTLRANVSGGTAPYTYFWSDSSSSSAIVKNKPGTYSVTITDASGCKSNCNYTINGPSNPCSPNNRYYTYTNLDSLYTFTPIMPANTNASYVWQYGNTTQTSRVSTFVLVSGLNYIKLKYCIMDSSNAIICCDSFTNSVYYYPPVPCNINANFHWATTANGGTIAFMDSTTPLSSMYTYQWFFGDSTFSSQKNPTKTYNTNGSYSVKLIVTRWSNGSNQVCRDTIVKVVTVSNVNPCNKLVPNFTWTYANGSYQISNLTNMSGFNTVSTTYTVSNGSTFNVSNPSITFTNNGSYAITLTVVGFDVSTGVTCTKKITRYISVQNSICGSLKAYNSYVKTGMQVVFTNSSQGTDTSTAYNYFINNGMTSTSPSPTFTFSLPGVYRVVMYVTKTVGTTICKDSTVKIIHITSPNLCKDSGFTTYANYNCGTYTSPVCGCDSATYQNYCFAYKAGVKQYASGPCPNDTTYVKICGFVYHDFNKNCVRDSSEPGINSVRISINSNPPISVYTNSTGFYTAYVKKGTYTITQNLTNSQYSAMFLNQLCPANNASITVAANTPGVYCNNNFYDTASICPDLSVTIGRAANITPGFTSMKWLRYQNRGATPIQNAVLKYRFLSNLTVLTTTTSTYTVSGNVITWNLGTLAPYSSGVKRANFSTPVTLPLGTVVVDSAWIEPVSGDCNTSNNVSTYHDTCVGSWDPNDKAVAPQGDILPTEVNLNYHIRFQNTGTAPAHNVVISDVLDNNLEESSIVVNSTSHQPMNMVMDDNREINFEFPGIMLPDSGTDYEASQGFVNFSIQRKPNLPLGTQIKNTAHIYFDFNEAVITNTTVTTINLKSTTGVQTILEDAQIKLYPNPTSESATIKIESPKLMRISYQMYDLNGRMVQSQNESNPSLDFEKTIQMKSMTNGIYILNININGEMKSLKLVKE